MGIHIGGTEDDYSYGLDTDSSGNIYAVGSFKVLSILVETLHQKVR